jgi:hypothetical protein
MRRCFLGLLLGLAVGLLLIAIALSSGDGCEGE